MTQESNVVANGETHDDSEISPAEAHATAGRPPFRLVGSGAWRRVKRGAARTARILFVRQDPRGTAVMIGSLAAFVFAACGGALIFGTSGDPRILGGAFPHAEVLLTVYLLYFLSFAVFVHLLAYMAFKYMSISFRALFPKLLDYAYLLILSFSLFQAASNYSLLLTYYDWLTGGLDKTINEARDYARRDLVKNCSRQTKYYDAGYCAKLSELSAASDEDIVGRIAHDADLLDHTFGYFYAGQGAAVPIYSPIRRHLYSARGLSSLRAQAAVEHTDVWGIFAIFALPIGLALRLLKTSFEIGAARSSARPGAEARDGR